ncbi:hypothetical protein QQ045_004351 [Rhodiola kirilowii]
MRELRHVIFSVSLQIISLIETKCNQVKMESARIKLGFDNYFSVPARGRSGGLAILWRDLVDVKIQNYSQYHIDFLVLDARTTRFTLFYGSPVAHQRSKSWDLLQRLKGMFHLPWCIFGDFNEITKRSETSQWNPSRLGGMEKFNSVIRTSGLFDLGFCGEIFTCSNRRTYSHEVKCRLNRGFANKEWLNIYASYSVSHLHAFSSDHKLLIIRLCRQEWRRKAQFRFENMWLRHESFRDFVQSQWEQAYKSDWGVFESCGKGNDQQITAVIGRGDFTPTMCFHQRPSHLR